MYIFKSVMSEEQKFCPFHKALVNIGFTPKPGMLLDFLSLNKVAVHITDMVQFKGGPSLII